MSADFGRDAAAVSALAVELGALLLRRGWKVATAESCTGGLIAGAITDVAGSSGWLDRGFVTYSNEAKREMLGVAAATVAEFGAVSEETAREMASGAVAHSAADWSVAVTGIAGPGGGSPGKPVGLVCFAWARRGGSAESASCRFDGDRGSIRAASVAQALRGLIERVRDAGD